MPKRLLLKLEYFGGAYCGWQRQLNGPSVQEEVEKALCRLTGEMIIITGASRTDAGVHALGQHAHFDTRTRIPAEKLPFALNTLLPRDIRALQCFEVPEGFSARFNARGKEYGYLILNRRHASALLKDYSAHVSLPLDVEAMRRAAEALPGRHDFAAFQASGGSAKTTLRRITGLSLHREGEEIRLLISGDAFLYNMVRIIAGSLIQVGLGKLPEDCFSRAFGSLDRLDLGPTAPAQGLTLREVFYEGLS